MTGALADRLARLGRREVAAAGPGTLWDGAAGWRAMSAHVSARALAPARALTAEGPRMAFGEPPLPEELPGPLTERPRYVLHGRNVFLAGQRALIDDDPGVEGHDFEGPGARDRGVEGGPLLFNDVCLLPEPFFDHATPLSRFPAEFKMTPAVTRTGERLRIAADPGAVSSIAEPVIALASTEARNYGSWLFRILPKLLTLDTLGPEAEGRALLLPMEAPWMAQLAKALAPGRRIVAQDITGVTHLADVLAPSLLASSNVFPQIVRERLAGLADHALARRDHGADAGRQDFGPRLYVSRRRWSERVPRRVLENEAELAAALEGEGFAEIFPETLPFLDRVAAFAQAEIVVGPTGSGLFNAVFCRPGTLIVEIEPHGAFRAMHGALYRSLGLAHAFLRGEVTGPGSGPAHPDWRIDPAYVVDSLRRAG